MRSRLAALDVYYGWVVVAACFLGTLVVFGISYSFGVFFEALLDEFGLSRGATSLVFSVQTFVTYLGAAAIGPFVDRYGVRRLSAAGVVLVGVGLIATSQATSVAALVFAYGVVAALGLGAVYVVSYATVPRWFGRQRGFAGGVATSGLGLGMLALAPAASYLVATYGWRSAYLVIVVAMVGALLVATLLLADAPVALGVDASGQFPDGHGADPGTPAGWREQIRDLVAVAGTRSFALVFAGWVLVYGTMYAIFVHLVAYAGDLGMSASVGAAALGVIGATTSVARLGLGFYSDRLGRTRVFVACSVAMAVATLLLPLSTTPTRLVAVAAAFGAGYGGNGALLSPLTADLFGTDNINATFGLVSLSFAVSGLVAPTLAGVGYDLLGSYDVVFVAAGALGLVGAGLVALAGRREDEL